MEDFDKVVVRSIAIVIVALIAMSGGCTMHGNYLVAEAVSKGADPIDARCGIIGTSEEKSSCAIRAARAK